MIPQSSAGSLPCGHPMRVPSHGPRGVEVAQESAQYDPPAEILQSFTHMPQSQLQTQSPISQQPIVNLTASESESQDKEPPPKRPKLDMSGKLNLTDAGLAVNTRDRKSASGSASLRPPLSWRGRPLWSFEAVVSDIPGYENRGDLATQSKPSSPPKLPAQPWNGIPADRLPSMGSRSRGLSPTKPVQTTPFRIETPPAAPLLKTDSKCTK